MIEHLIGEEGMSSEDKCELITRTFPSCLLDDPEALGSFINSIQHRQVRALLESETRLWSGPLTHNLEKDPNQVLTELYSGSDLGDRNSNKRRDKALIEAFQNASDRISILDAIKRSEVIEHKEALYEGIFMEWLTVDMNNALRHLTTLEEPDVIDSVISQRWKSIANYDAVAAAAWIETIKSDKLREETMTKYQDAYKDFQRK